MYKLKTYSNNPNSSQVYSIPYSYDPYQRNKSMGRVVLPVVKVTSSSSSTSVSSFSSVNTDNNLSRELNTDLSLYYCNEQIKTDNDNIYQQQQQQQEVSNQLSLIMACFKRIQFRWFIDAFCIITAAALLIIVELGWVPSIQTGFYCDDPSISYKYNGDTISVTILLAVCITLPLFVIWAIEAGCCFCQGNVIVRGLKERLKRGLSHAWVWYREYFLGLVLVLLMVDIAKVLVGEPRPHFLDTCKPDVAETSEKCKSAASPTGFIENFKCSNEKLSLYKLRDSSRSFPSGHAAVSFYFALFLIWFLQRRMPNIPNKLPSLYIRPWMQIVFVSWAMACSFTRITDHRHHAHDVLAGAVLGTVMAILIIRNYCGGFWPGFCATRLHEESISSSVERSGGNGPRCTMLPSGGSNCVVNDNKHITENGHPNGGIKTNQSMRRLLSSTSSYSGSIVNDADLREVTQA